VLSDPFGWLINNLTTHGNHSPCPAVGLKLISIAMALRALTTICYSEWRLKLRDDGGSTSCSTRPDMLTQLNDIFIE